MTRSRGTGLWAEPPAMGERANSIIGRLVFPVAAFLSGLITAPVSARQVIVQPEETQELLANPGRGWQTFHQFADEDPHLAGLPSGVAYYRFYWKDVEPEEGNIDFKKMDDLLARARKAGQRLAFRIMCVGTNEDAIHVPQWLKDSGCRGFTFTYGDDGIERWAPDYEDQRFQRAHFRMIEALGERYDGHPDVDHIDIGTVGLWAEWHMSGTGVDMPATRTQRKIINAWRKAFPNTPKLLLIGADEGMNLAGKWKLGWRADCLGDMGGFSKNWNHMDHYYRQQLEKTNATNAWKQAPVAFETCWDMRKWVKEGWSVRYIFDYALSLHTSYINNKSAPLPDGQRGEIERFLRKLGYRLVLRKLSHADEVSPGASFKVAMVWKNAGVAPPYRDWRLALRLSNDDHTFTHITKTSVRGWLPGDHQASPTWTLPVKLPPGTYRVEIGIVDPTGGNPVVRLPLPDRTADGWYPVSTLRVGNSSAVKKLLGKRGFYFFDGEKFFSKPGPDKPHLEYPLFSPETPEKPGIYFFDGELLIPRRSYRVIPGPDGKLKFVPNPPVDPNAPAKLLPVESR